MISNDTENLDDLENNNYFCMHDDNVYLFSFGECELYSEKYLRWMNDFDITKTIGRFDYLMPVTRAKLVDYFNSIDKRTTVFLAIYLREPDSPDVAARSDLKFIGTLKIYDIDLLSKKASLGIAIGDKEEWGKGYAVKAVNLAVKYVFDILGLRKISAGYMANNVGMERVFLNCGFNIEATFKEHIFYQGQYIDHKFVCKFRN